MGPTEGTLEEVKRDAISATVRHFKREEDDNGFEAAIDLDEVEQGLLLDNGGFAKPKKAGRPPKAEAQPEGEK